MEADRHWIGLGWWSSSWFVGVEVAAGLIADSPAVLSDAAHMLSGAASVALLTLAARPTDRKRVGLGRAQIVSTGRTASLFRRPPAGCHQLWGG